IRQRVAHRGTEGVAGGRGRALDLVAPPPPSRRAACPLPRAARRALPGSLRGSGADSACRSRGVAGGESEMITYGGVPSLVSQVAVYEWSESAPRPLRWQVTRLAADVMVDGTPRRSVIVLFIRADGTYLIDGPMS